MTVTPTEAAGRLQHLARDFSASLEAGNETAAQEMLAAWSDAYWGTRSELDSLIAYVRKAKAEGQAISPSWLSRERRLKAVLATAKAELEKYAKAGARAATRAQEQALRAAVKQAPALVKAALAEQLPGLAVDLAQVNPALLQNVVGFLGDGTPLADHLARTVAPDAVDGLRQVLLDGLSKGWGQDRMVREFTKSFAVPHSRAVTIMRTESLRVYRETSRQSYEANRKVVQSWTWQCALDSRSCAGCVMMHGTKHPVEETLDGHPRCRCSMIPNTPTWAELGLPGIEETRVEVPTGEDWFRQQSTGYQRGLLGPGKFDAWKRGELALPDVVARRYDPDWGSMRLERSLKSIRENRNANWGGLNDELGPRPGIAPPPPDDFDRWNVGRHERLDPGNLPDFDPANPLAAYGDRLTVYDQSPTTRAHLTELERDVSLEHHQVLRDHMAGTSDGGFYIGDRAVPDLDDMGHLKGVQPRGWDAGKTWDEVPGAYDPTKRACMCGGGGQGHGSTSLALHETGHALDTAMGTASNDLAKIISADPDLSRAYWKWNPYFRADGNPTGWASEAFAEGFASWTRVRILPRDDQLKAIRLALENIDLRSPLTLNDRSAYGALADYFSGL